MVLIEERESANSSVIFSVFEKFIVNISSGSINKSSSAFKLIAVLVSPAGMTTLPERLEKSSRVI